MRRRTNEYSIDANVILRFLVGDNPKLARNAHEIMLGVQSGNITVICDPVNLAEIVWVLRSFYKLSNERICQLLEPILNLEGFLVPDKDRYLFALKLFAGGLRSFGDACACAASLQDCDGKLYSFDADLSNVQGIARSDHLG